MPRYPNSEIACVWNSYGCHAIRSGLLIKTFEGTGEPHIDAWDADKGDLPCGIRGANFVTASQCLIRSIPAVTIAPKSTRRHFYN